MTWETAAAAVSVGVGVGITWWCRRGAKRQEQASAAIEPPFETQEASGALHFRDRVTEPPAAPAAPRPAALEIVAPPAKLACKDDWSSIAAWAEQHQVRELYHFTDAANIESILRHGGLYSWSKCLDTGIKIPVPGGDGLSRGLDARAGLEDYVRLSFHDDHPMKHHARREGRIVRPVLLHIDLAVLWARGTLYCPINATRREAVVGGTLESLRRVRLSACRPGTSYFDLSSVEQPYLQAEVLVPSHVPLAYIKNIEAVAAQVQRSSGRRA